MQKKFKGSEYLFALLVTLGCALFILYPVIIIFLFSYNEIASTSFVVEACYMT